MSRTNRSFVITLTIFAAFAVTAYWGGRSVFGVAAIGKSSSASTSVATTPLNAITSFDSAMIMRQPAGIPLPTNNHKCAGDVTNNGNVNANDGAIVSRYVVSLDINALTGTTVAAPCHANFPTTVPVLKGDATGQDPVISLGHGSANVGLPALNPPPGTITVPVMVGDITGLDIYSFDFQVTYDPAILQPAGGPTCSFDGHQTCVDQNATVSHSIAITPNASNPGHLIVSGFTVGLTPISGSGTLLNLRFDVVGSAGQSTALTFEDYTGPDSRAHQGFLFNEGQAVAVTTNGSVTVAPSAVSGVVTYGNALGSAPVPRYVPDVVISSNAGSPAVTGTSAINGNYWVTGFGAGSYTLTASKAGGANGAINSFDAAKIAQHIAGTAFLTGNQLVVADVSGNGAVSSFDAGRVAAFVAGAPPFGLAGTWKLLPAQRTYPSVGSYIVGDNYSALLMGEASGNWTVNGSQAGRTSNGAGRSVGVSAAQLSVSPGSEILVPVSIRGGATKGIISYEFDLRYDPRVIQPQAIAADLAGTVSRGLSVVTNAKESGILRVVVYGPVAINSDGVLLNLRFTAVGKPGSVSPISFERIMFNEGDPRVNAAGGQVELF